MTVKIPGRIDYSALTTRATTTNDDPSSIQDSNPSAPLDNSQPNNYVNAFDRAFATHLSVSRMASLTKAEAASATLPTASTETLYNQWAASKESSKGHSTPLKAESRLLARDVSERTKRLLDIKVKMSKTKNITSEFKAIQEEIKASSLQDYVDWVDRNVTLMEAANTRGDTRALFATVNHIYAKPKPAPHQNLTTDEGGNLLYTKIRKRPSCDMTTIHKGKVRCH